MVSEFRQNQRKYLYVDIIENVKSRTETHP